MATKAKPIIAMPATVSIEAAAKDGEHAGPAKFVSTFYTGGAMNVEGWDQPVVIDLAGLKLGKVLVANLDHDPTKRVGNFAVANDGKTLVANGTATAATAARDEVVASAAAGYEWQASLEVRPHEVDSVKAGKTVEVNGQTHTGPLYVTRVGTLKGFAFVSHGADDNTTASIAASAATNKEIKMKAEVKTWIKAMVPSMDVDNLSEDEVERIEEQYAGLHPVTPKKKQKLGEGIEAKQAEFERQDGITEIALNACDKRPYDIKSIQELAQQAIDAKWSVEKFRLELLEASLPPAQTVFRTRKDERLTSKVLEAAICQAGRLEDLEKKFDEQTLQVAHDRFKGRIGLKQLFLVAAQANGYHDHNLEVTEDVLRAAFANQGQAGSRRDIHAQGFSALDIANTLAATANKFIFRGWNMVDQTCLRIAKIQNVRDFKTATTVSLTDSLIYEKVGTGGQIRHGTLADQSYTVKAETYAKMLAITRQDIINDDLGALTDVPMKLGNGAIKILNDIFWSKFLGLVPTDSFFAAGNNNINTAVADMTVGGLDATEVIFRNQTNPDGTPLGLLPAIILVPTALYNKALTLMGSQGAAYVAAYATASGDKNPFFGRYRVETSPYISNSSYTGYTSTAWWMLANPEEMPVMTIAALNGNVMPTVDTAQAAFNVLGVEMRGYSDIGVNSTEKRGGVHADGGSS
jgi:hypothetical protein